MTFVQLMEYRTRQPEEMARLFDRWLEQTEGRRTATHGTLTRDRDASDRYVEIVEFPSYEEAMRNSRLPETGAVFEQMSRLCEEPPTFRNLDVLQDQDM
ncbi:MAG TPA: hypothetical protein VIL00_08315 [Pseudonocardiaceae bacterium]